MKTIKAFISYSSDEKKIAGVLKVFLQELCGYEVFTAHDDMIPATDFKDEIIAAIKDADFFIPLISELFSRSVYTDQEVGMAIGLGKKIIPVKFNKNPYGFISDYQALSANPDSIESMQELATRIGILGVKHVTGEVSEKAKNSIVMALNASQHYRHSNVIIKILCECEKYNSKQLEVVANAIKNNKEVQGAFALKSLSTMLKNQYKIEVEINNQSN